MLVVDASVTMTWCFADEAHAASEAVFHRVLRERMIVPAHWLLEVTNVVGRHERQGRLTADDRGRFFRLLQDARAKRRLRIEPLDERLIFGRVWDLSQQYGLTTYDAAYLELASRRGLALATYDTALQKAAAAEGVALVGDAPAPPSPEPITRTGGPSAPDVSDGRGPGQ